MEDLEEIRRELLALVQEGLVCVTKQLHEGDRRTFVASIYATEEDKEFTKVWLQDPHFGLDS